MKLISWNVNGIRACLNKGLASYMESEQADVYCFQETKIQQKDFDKLLDKGHFSDFTTTETYAVKNGYSGLLTLSKKEPISVQQGLQVPKFDQEARTHTLEFEDFYLINCYFPNSQRGLARLDFKLEFNKELQKYAGKLRKDKHVVITGDFNVSHNEIDLANPKQNVKNAGFCPEEREWMTQFLSEGYVDTFREFETEGGHYSWWTYRANARKRNVGWRLDYFLVDQDFRASVVASDIRSDILGSDHCPVRLVVEAR